MKKLILIAIAASAMPAANALVIDDFTTGPLDLTLNSTGEAVTYQSGSMAGGVREVRFRINNDDRQRPGDVYIDEGFLSVDTGVGTLHRLQLGYGFDTSGNKKALNLDIGSQDFQVNFDFNDLRLKTTMLVYSGSNVSTATKTIAGDQFNPFVVNFSQSDFSGSADFTKIDQIFFIGESDVPRGGNDWAITSIQAVPEPASLLGAAMGLGALAARRRKR